jgi:phosphoribosylformylglycinamidine synthase
MENTRVFIEKKELFNVEAKNYLDDFKNYLGISNLEKVRVINVYDIKNANENETKKIIEKVLYEPYTDLLYTVLTLGENEKAFRFEAHKGQFNQREDSTNEIIKKFLNFDDIEVKHSKIIVLSNVSDEEFEKIKTYYINPIEYREIDLDYVDDSTIDEAAKDVEIISGFINMSEYEVMDLKNQKGLGMDMEDLLFCQSYFKSENRDPSIAELRVIDTYWSDHCRHTTFMTEITDIQIEDGKYKEIFEEAIKEYLKSKKYVYEDKERATSLMDLATINMKEIKKKGLLDDKEETDEVNAASIVIDVDVNGKNEKYLLMFKNETHNHPTEMEPFGGAATCLGGGIRDPLSGRAYVYQAMRITGAADPRQKFEDTLKGKLPQRKITQTAMEGYSSYGNQIGATSGYIKEFYDEGFVAKRMELGALVAAAPKDWVVRGKSEPTDLILLVGGRTGRDGLGAAVGSSKVQTEKSLEKSGAEVQKGNPVLERKIVRLFRNPNATKLIKKCNDFGAGGVAVAVGELADSLYIDLNKVPLKYEGLDGAEIALSESQERMAVVIDKENLDEFMSLVKAEDLEATVIAQVTDTNRLQMVWQGKMIIDIDREFLNTNGIRKKAKVNIAMPNDEMYLINDPCHVQNKGLKEAFIENIKELNVASQKGLVERFDNTIGSGTVLMQLGGKEMVTPQEGMVAKIPVPEGETTTCSMMTYGYDPKLAKWSTFHGGYYAVIESIAKIVALGGDYRKVRLTFQEYFERLGDNPTKWGKPFASLLGAFLVQKNLDIPSIGGKDSMSGSFGSVNVPPSLLSFAVSYDKVDNIVSKEFKEVGSNIVMVNLHIDDNGLVNFEQLKKNYIRINELIDKKKVLASSSITFGGIAKSIAEMTLGNKIGCEIEESIVDKLYKPLYGSIILEISNRENIEEIFEGIDYSLIGRTIAKEQIEIKDEIIGLDELLVQWEEPLKEVFPTDRKAFEQTEIRPYTKGTIIKKQRAIVKPKVIIPIFTGTHGEYDMARSFEKAGAEVETYVFKSLTKDNIEESYKILAEKIKNSQILGLPHGQIYGDEPEAGGKLLNIIFNNPYIKESLDELLENRDGLILGIGEGALGLIKAGLLQSPYITNNIDGKFISTMVDVKVVSNLSPWMNEMEVGEVYTVPIATKEGRILLGNSADELLINGQLVTQFVSTNPTGSDMAVESFTSKDGRILGTITSIDRMGEGVYKNVKIKGRHKIFESGVKYFV